MPEMERTQAPQTVSSRDNREKMLERAMSRHHFSGDALIEVLHTAQELYGYLTPELLKSIARRLRVPPSRVLGVTTFYHFFSLKPKGEHAFIVCTGTACYVKGAFNLLERLEKRCGCKSGSTSADGKVSIGSARCIGSCGLAPAVIHNGNIMARVTPEQIDSTLERIGVK